jgi:hypothetical protein
MSDGLGERMAAVEADVAALKADSRALQATLHDLIRSALADHSATITRLAAAHDQRLGAWWTIIWIAGGLVLAVGAFAWLLEHNIKIVVQP